jgi:hypothetical protein
MGDWPRCRFDQQAIHPPPMVRFLLSAVFHLREGGALVPTAQREPAKPLEFRPAASPW